MQVTVSEVKEYLSADWTSVQDSIRTYLGTDISLLNTANESVLSGGGKQLRPMLALLMARACGGACNAASVKYAAASELMHNATLLHDDVADESDYRRGKPTIRKMMGPGVSVLLGDFWLVRALNAILDGGLQKDRVLEMFATTLSDLAEGEMLQLQKASTMDTVFEDYLAIIYRKTASLFVSSTRTAAISVDAPAEYEKAAAEYGENLGYAFQMRDDIFDYMPDAQVGKPVGVDIVEHKITLPLLGALENMGPARADALRARLAGDVSPELRDEVIQIVRREGGIEYAQGVLEQYVERAVKALEVLPASKEKEILCNLANYTAIRNI